MAVRSLSSEPATADRQSSVAEHAQCRPIRLRSRPAGDIQRCIRIDAGLAQHRRPETAAISASGRAYWRKDGSIRSRNRPAQKLPTVQTAQGQAEIEKLAETVVCLSPRPSLGHGDAQSAHDDRRVAEPMKEIVGVGIVGGGNRRRQHGPGARNDICPNPGRCLTVCVAEIARDMAIEANRASPAIQSSRLVILVARVGHMEAPSFSRCRDCDPSESPSPRSGEGGAKRRMGCGKQVWRRRKFAAPLVQSCRRRSSGPYPIRPFGPPSPASWGRGHVGDR